MKAILLFFIGLGLSACQGSSDQRSELAGGGINASEIEEVEITETVEFLSNSQRNSTSRPAGIGRCLIQMYSRSGSQAVACPSQPAWEPAFVAAATSSPWGGWFDRYDSADQYSGRCQARAEEYGRWCFAGLKEQDVIVYATFWEVTSSGTIAQVPSNPDPVNGWYDVFTGASGTW